MRAAYWFVLSICFSVFFLPEIIHSASANSASTPTMDCKSSGSCAVDGHQYPSQVCFGIYGACPKETMSEYSTPCKSILGNINKHNAFIEHTDEDGFPKYASTNNDKAPRSEFNPGAAPASGYAALTRMWGDDDDKRCGPSEPGKGRTGGYCKLIEKGDDECLWFHEMALSVGSTALACAGQPQSTGTSQLYAGNPDIVCRKQQSNAGSRNAFRDTRNGKRNDPGEVLARQVEKQMMDPSDPDASGNYHGNFALQEKPLAGKTTFSAGQNNRYYDRSTENGNPIKVASNMLFLNTPSYATYDPNDYRPGQELRLAKKLFEKTPEQIAQFKASPSPLGNNDAFAFGTGGSGNIQGIMCRLEPDTCHLTSHFDRDGQGIVERFGTGLEFAHQTSSPNVQFVSNLAEKFGNIDGLINQLGGQLMSEFFKEEDDQQYESIGRTDYLQCLSAMAVDTSTAGSEQASARLLEGYIKANCDDTLVRCLQSQSGYSERSLEYCYNIINNPSSASSGGSGGGGGSSMPDIGSFIFGSGGGGYGGLNASNLGSLGGANIGQLNDVLMQQVEGLSGLGGIASSLSGGAPDLNQLLGKTLQDFRQNPYLQTFYPANIFDMRSATNLYPERDHYSVCAGEQKCMASKNEAGYNFWLPYAVASNGSKANESEADVRTFWNTTLALQRADPTSGYPFGIPTYSSDSPTDFINPSPRAIGSPVTTADTGPVLTREDGTSYYAFKPDEPLDFIHKDRYFSHDVSMDDVSEQLASYLPEAPITQTIWDELAAAVDADGSLASATPERIAYFVEKVNEDFKAKGVEVTITEELFKPSPVDHFLHPGAPEENSGFSVGSLLEGVGVNPALAQSGQRARSPMPIGANAAGSGTPAPSVGSLDWVRCTGQRDVDQWRTDVTDPRYSRFNSHMLQRITYNRWCWADYLDPLRCTPNHVCAPKPCPPRMACWTRRCWSNPCSARPHIKHQPSADLPIAQVRYDYGEDVIDIGHAKNITRMCRKVPSPLYKEVDASDCNAYDPGCPPSGAMTRAYNCRTYPNGKRYCGRTWAYHPDVKYVLDVWNDEMGGDFQWKAGERHMNVECHHLAMPMENVNKVQFASMEALDQQGSRTIEGGSFTSFFGTRRPYIKQFATGLEYGQQPGQIPDYRSSRGAYITVSTGGSADPQTQQANITAFNTLNNVLNPSPDAPQNVLSLASSAFARNGGGGNQGSSMACFGGLGGKSDGSCPSGGYHSQMSGMVEYNLLQARTHRNTGHCCSPHLGRTFWMGDEGMVANALGAQFGRLTDASVQSEKILRPMSYPLSDPGWMISEDSKGQSIISSVKTPPAHQETSSIVDMIIANATANTNATSGNVRPMTFPLAARGWLHDPDTNEQFPYGGGAAAPTVYNGAEAIIELGEEAAGIVLRLERGGARMGETPGMPKLAVVTSVGENYIDVTETNCGLHYDASGRNSGAGQVCQRRYWKEGEMPENEKAANDDADIPLDSSCVNYGNSVANCHQGEWDTMIGFRIGTDDNNMNK